MPTGPPQNAPAPDKQVEPDNALGPLIAPDKQAQPGKAPGTGTVTAFEGAAPDQPLQPADEALPIAFRAPLAQDAPATSLRKYLVLAAVLVAAAAAVWLGVRAANPPTTPTMRSETAAPAPAGMTAQAARPQSVPAGAPPSVPEPAAATGTPTSPVAGATAAAAPSAAAATATAERFEIVVASFRIDAGATSVAAQVTALGLPNRRRVLDGWQQVLAGPFASRAEAEEAQQRLDRAGLTRTQIVVTAR